MGVSFLGAQVVAEPDLARERILAALVESKGDRGTAATALGTTQRNLYRLIDRLRMWPTIDALMQQHGYMVASGPPRFVTRLASEILAARGNLRTAARKLGLPNEAALRERIEHIGFEAELNTMLVAAGCDRIATPNITADLNEMAKKMKQVQSG